MIPVKYQTLNGTSDNLSFEVFSCFSQISRVRPRSIIGQPFGKCGQSESKSLVPVFTRFLDSCQICIGFTMLNAHTGSGGHSLSITHY